MVNLGSSLKDQFMTGEVLGGWKELAAGHKHKLEAHLLQSPRAATIEPSLLEPVLGNKRTHHTEKPTPQLESSLHSLQLEKSLCDNEDSAQPKINK